MTNTKDKQQTNTDTLMDAMNHDLDQSTQAAAMQVIEEIFSASKQLFEEKNAAYEKNINETIQKIEYYLRKPDTYPKTKLIIDKPKDKRSYAEKRKEAELEIENRKSTNNHRKPQEKACGIECTKNNPKLNTNSSKEVFNYYLASLAKEQALQANTDKLNHYQQTLKEQLIELDDKKSELQQTIDNSIHQLTTGNIDDIKQQEKQQHDNQAEINTIEKTQKDISTKIESIDKAKPLINHEKEICSGIIKELKNTYFLNEYNEKHQALKEKTIDLIPMIEELNEKAKKIRGKDQKRWDHYETINQLKEIIRSESEDAMEDEISAISFEAYKQIQKERGNDDEMLNLHWTGRNC